MKFLVDECLSPELVKLAYDRGHGESSHVVSGGIYREGRTGSSNPSSSMGMNRSGPRGSGKAC